MTSRSAVQQMEDILAKNPELDAFTPTGGFPQFVPDAYRAAAAPYKERIASGDLALVVADTLPVQIELLKEGMSAGQVGQRPFEMGYKSMQFLQRILRQQTEEPERPDLYGPGRCTPDIRRTCIGG
jgi:ribose transport system substrate-binding protein